MSSDSFRVYIQTRSTRSDEVERADTRKIWSVWNKTVK
jgi:hypothetical protein